MYAVICSGGKQYRVEEGQTLKLEKLVAEEGSTINFNEVLLLAKDNNVKVGAPHVAGCKVTAEVIKHARHDKIRIVKFRRRKHHDKQMGHRQDYTEVKITQISA